MLHVPVLSITHVRVSVNTGPAANPNVLSSLVRGSRKAEKVIPFLIPAASGQA